jgi:hypothetical protein
VYGDDVGPCRISAPPIIDGEQEQKQSAPRQFQKQRLLKGRRITEAK